MDGQFAGKVALVTGAGSGIGRASALAFAREGARVVVADLDRASGAETAGLVRAAGGDAQFIAVDVARAADVAALVTGSVAAYGRLDYAFNNAGVARGGGPMAEVSEEDWDATIAVNLTGVWLCMKHEIPQMLARGGAIVNTASVAGLRAEPLIAAYTASKHGVVGLTKATAIQYAQRGVRINAVCPGWIDTPMVARAVAQRPAFGEQIVAREPIGRLGRPEEVAAAVLWLCSDAASFVTGSIVTVDGGLSA